MSDAIQWHTSMSLVLERQVDTLCDEFEEKLRRNTTPKMDDYLERIDESARPHLLSELKKLLDEYAPDCRQWLGEPQGGDVNDVCSPAGLTSERDSENRSVDNTTWMALQGKRALCTDAEVARFQQSLECGELPSIEQIVQATAPGARHALLRELLRLEMEFRGARGDSPTLAEFQTRFSNEASLVKFLYFEHFIPERVGEFPIRKALGSGGFGQVYQAWDPKLSRNVAIKVFRRDPDAPSWPGGLLVEARAAAKLRHPGIVTVHAVQSDAEGDEFLVLEFVDGTSLEDVLRTNVLPPLNAATIMLAVARALEHAHDQGLAHRDLKPANILLDRGREPRVTDFGLALHLADVRSSQGIAGTLPYMAPEQVAGETHRIDGRTDIWALGVTFYRTLTGKLPFSAGDRQALLDAICHKEPQDLLHGKSAIPTEIARIVWRCLAKRMCDRYQSAAELGEDLSAFLRSARSPVRGNDTDRSSSTTPAVVPKGLRCFDAADREFFLALVPGPRDRYGVPQAVRFWEHRLQPNVDVNQNIRVGLIHGPSGSGKSSLLRAGILPRLPSRTRYIVIEAAHEGSESKLLDELRGMFPQIDSHMSLTEALGVLREGARLAPDEKLLIVIDQFEQWLHGWDNEGATSLIDAMRQCDGNRVQALVLVRDDFWTLATRFFKELEVPLVEGSNTCAVELFDRPHAVKILTAFGAAYGRLPADPGERTSEQQQFVELAIDELSEGGWIVPVRLSIFVEMVKSRPWTPASLRELGGTRGLGTAFLEEVFDGRSASPTHRAHRRAARLALERLLPPAGSNIRGYLVPETELRIAAGHEQRPAEFDGLLNCLDHDLKLIKPSYGGTQTEDADVGEKSSRPARCFQLTHDFLVSAIRDWLNQTRRRSQRGRAELRLAEYAGAFATCQESRQLPSWWAWLSILLLTQRRRWTATEQTMMNTATRRHAVRVGIFAAAVIVIGALVLDRMSAIQADGLVRALVTCDSRDLPSVIASLPRARQRVEALLTERLEAQVPDHNQRVRILLGLAGTERSKANDLCEEILVVEPQLAVAIVDVLLHVGQMDQMQSQLWIVAEDPRVAPSRRLRACMAIAKASPEVNPEKWAAMGATTTGLLLRDLAENPSHFNVCVDALLSARNWLVGPLSDAFANARATETDRLLIANILVHYAFDDIPKLLELALQSRPLQFEIFARVLLNHADLIRPHLRKVAGAQVPADAAEDERDMIARRQANAISLLLQVGDDQLLWPALQHTPDTRLRSFLIDHWQRLPATAGKWQRRLSDEADPGVRQALILILGGTASTYLGPEQRDELTERLMAIHRDDTDSGVHGAAEWALRRLGCDSKVDQSIAAFSSLGLRPGYRWYVTKSGITMVVFNSPGAVSLGSSESEPGRDTRDETAWTYNLNWSFAISAQEITQNQFYEICPDYRNYLNEQAPLPSCPVNATTWLDAVKFCRLLGERDGIPDTSMVIPAVENLKKGPYADLLTHGGYRLPVEAEWEVACRAGSTTPRFFGYATDLLSSYCCYIASSGGQSRSVGEGLPNAAGLFDMLGNVAEWCYNRYDLHPELRPDRMTKAVGFSPLENYFAIRGNDYTSNARMTRTANRRFAMYSDTLFGCGMRVAHTIQSRHAVE